MSTTRDAYLEDLDRQYAMEAAEGEPVDLSHDGLAIEMADTWQVDARYLALRNTWLFWTGQQWQPDQVLLHMTRARSYLRGSAEALIQSAQKDTQHADDPGAGQKNREVALLRQTVANVLSLARSDPRLAATIDQWDRDPYLLGASRYCNLRTGEIKPPDSLDYVTKIAAVAPAPPGTPHPSWSAFLERITAGDRELQAYLQRMAGYCLTGDISAHVLFFLYGTGANGKSVFINTLLGIWKDYAITIGSEMLMVSNTDRHPTEIARLCGVRLAVANEVEVGKTWAESKIKQLTGGERLQGRFMHQDFFEFAPQFKLVIVGNHKPALRGVDEAIRRRLHVIPFAVTIPVDQRDPLMVESLRPEWPAILRWAVDGCLEWQRQGLNPPKGVRAATDNYLAAEDSFELWRETCTTPDVKAWESSSDLWASWKRWAEHTGEFVGKQKAFSQLLIERGFRPHRVGTAGTRGFSGASLNRPDFTDDRRYGG